MKESGHFSSLRARERRGAISSGPQVALQWDPTLENKKAACITETPVVAQDSGLDPRALSKSIPKLRSLDT